jgi:hypothetical protein
MSTVDQLLADLRRELRPLGRRSLGVARAACCVLIPRRGS